jgi:hypothetical protein
MIDVADRLERIADGIEAEPAPVRDVKVIRVDAFKQSIELLELIARTSDDDLTVNRLGHAIRMLRGEEAPVPF